MPGVDLVLLDPALRVLNPLGLFLFGFLFVVLLLLPRQASHVGHLLDDGQGLCRHNLGADVENRLIQTAG